MTFGVPISLPPVTDAQAAAFRIAVTGAVSPALGDTLDDISGELRELLQLADRLHELVRHGAGGADALIELAGVDGDGGAAAAAGEVRLALEPSDLAFRLVAALRAGNVDLRLVEIELNHLFGTPVQDPGAENTGSGSARQSGDLSGAAESPHASSILRGACGEGGGQ